MEPINVSFFANPDDPQATPLHWAALRGNLDEVQALLAAEPGTVAVADSNGWIALHWAAGAGQAECAALLVKAGASLEARGSEMHTPWGAKLAKVLILDSPARHAEVKELEAAGFVERAQNMREAMAQPDAKATAGATPLHVAAGMGAVDCICCLLQLGAQLDAANSCGVTAMHVAAACNHVPALQALAQAGADVHAGDGGNNTPLHMAAGLDSLECLQDLIRLGAIINVRGHTGTTPLHSAAGTGATACVKELLAAGADMEAVAAHNARPLHVAAAGGRLEALCALIEAGADLHATAEHQQTALHFAAAAGCVEVALALMAAGADLEVATTQPCESKTPIQIAAAVGDTAMVSALAAAGANINRQGEHGITCLHLFLAQACQVCIPDAHKRLQQLMDAGASVQLACATWPTPVDAMLLCMENPRDCKLPSYVPELIRAMVAAGCSISPSRSSQQGDLMMTNSVITWCNRLADADADWPPSLSSSAVELGCVLLECLEAESSPEQGDNGFIFWSTLRTGSIQLAVRAAGLLLKVEDGEPVALFHVKQLFEHYMKGLPRPGWGHWGERHRRLVHHFCDMAEALLAAGCPPIELRVCSKDRAAVASAEPTHIPGARIFELDLALWAEPHLREVIPLAGSGLRWSPATHRAFPPRFRAAARALLLANHRGLAAPPGPACNMRDADTGIGLPKGRQRTRNGDTPAGTLARAHLPPEVVLLVLEKAAHLFPLPGCRSCSRGQVRQAPAPPAGCSRLLGGPQQTCLGASSSPRLGWGLWLWRWELQFCSGLEEDEAATVHLLLARQLSEGSTIVRPQSASAVACEIFVLDGMVCPVLV